MREKKDILFLCQFFYPEYISSAQLPYETAVALKEAGFTVGALCGYPKEYLNGEAVPTREQVSGIDIHRLKYMQRDRTGFVGRLVNYFSFTAMVALHLGQIARYKAVVVYSNPPILPWVASWAKKLFGTKLVFVAYDLYPELATVTDTLKEGGMICRLMNHINRCVFRRADQVVALSQEMREFILKNRPIAPEGVEVIPNWWPDKQLHPSQPNPFRELAGDRFLVSYLGNMGTSQDMQTVLEAIRILKEDKSVFFLFAGHGNKLEKLKKIAQEEQLENFCVRGYLTDQEYTDALVASDCALVTLNPGVTGLCVPSKTYGYMMAGLPLLVVMDDSDIARDAAFGAGVQIKGCDGAAMADAIRSMRDDPDKTAAMGKTSRALFLEKYTLPICTGKYVDMFRGLLAPGGGK